MLIKRLKDLREDNDLKQQEVADVLGIKQNVYSRYEVGHRTLPLVHLITLANFYKTSIDYLVGLTNEPTPYKHK